MAWLFKAQLLTVMAKVVSTEPQVLLTVYTMVSMPGAAPVTTPPDTAAAALVADHTPPVTPSVCVTELPLHTTLVPVIVPADAGVPFTVIAHTTTDAPQPLVTEYLIVQAPTLTPVTVSPNTVTNPEPILHV